MLIDPQTPIQRVVAALPTSLDVFQRFGIDVTENLTLQMACANAGVRLVDLESALNAIDWSRRENTES